MEINTYIRQLKNLLQNITEDNLNQSVKSVFDMVKKHPEVKNYKPKNAFYSDLIEGLLSAPTLIEDVASDINNTVRSKEEKRVEFARIKEAKADHAEYMQDLDVTTQGGIILLQEYTVKHFKLWIDGFLNYAHVYQVQHATHVNTEQAVTYLYYIIGGLDDLNSEVYRETHDTIPADTRDYACIHSQIHRTQSYYDKEIKTVKHYQPKWVAKKTLAPFGYCNSACGKYHRFGKREYKKAVEGIKNHANVQTSLF